MCIHAVCVLHFSFFLIFSSHVPTDSLFCILERDQSLLIFSWIFWFCFFVEISYDFSIFIIADTVNLISFLVLLNLFKM